MEQEKAVQIAALTQDSALEARIRRGIALWAEEQCVRYDLSRAEAADFRQEDSLSADLRGKDSQAEADGGAVRTLLIADFRDAAVEPVRCAVAVCARQREAIRAYRSHPAACVPPDFTYRLLCDALERCRDLWRRGLRRLSDLPMPMGQIQYAEAVGKETILHTPLGVERVKLLLGRVADLLPAPHFLRCHSGFLVALPAVAEVGVGEAVMVSGERIPVSRRYAGTLREAWQDWRRDREEL